MKTKCSNPPAGWYCSREPGHHGPCAASPTPPPFNTMDTLNIPALCKELREATAAALERLTRAKYNERIEWGYLDGNRNRVTLCVSEAMARELGSADPESVVKRVVSDWRSA